MQTTKTSDATAALEFAYRELDAGTKAFDQVLDDLFNAIDAENDHFFTERAETAPVQVAAARPVAPVPPRAPASGALKFAYRELDAGPASRRA